MFEFSSYYSVVLKFLMPAHLKLGTSI